MGLFGNLFGSKKESKIETSQDDKNRLYLLDKAVGDYIPKIMNNITPTLENPQDYTHVDKRIQYINEMIAAYDCLMNEAKKFPEEYKKYDQYWNHAHNSKCDDFSLINKYRDLRDELIANIDTIKKNEELHDTGIEGLMDRILAVIREQPGIIQTDLVKMFDESIKEDVRNCLYDMDKEGMIEREKSGRSYTLRIK